MKDEVTRLGVQEFNTVAEVDAVLGDHHGTTLVFVNSMCGCAAGMARPGLAMALRHAVKPDTLYTVFAGQELDATARVRSYFAEFQPSSPSFMLVKDGEMVRMVHRYEIEGRSAEQVAAALIEAFDAHCGGVAAEGSAGGARREARPHTGGIMLHDKREELHGITVVMTGASGRTYLGRFHETTDRGIAMRDVGVHDPATAGHDLASWVDRARQFGVPVEHRLLVVPTGEVGSIVRFADWSEKGEVGSEK